MLTLSPRHILSEILNTFGLQNIIDEPTRIGNFRQSLLDPIILSETCKSIDSSVLKVDRSISDHDGCLVSLEIPVNLKSRYKRNVWMYKHGNYDMFNNLISNFPWEETFLNCESVDSACYKFTETYLDMARQCIPSKSITIRPNDKPWMTSELRKNLRIRDRLHKKSRKTKLQADINKFKTQRNKVNNMKKFARLNFYENVNGIIERYSSSDPKSYWKLIKNLIKSNGSSQSIPSLVDPNSGDIVVNSNDKANVLNNYFSSVTQVDDANTPIPNIQSRCQQNLSYLRINESEIIDILKI